jgi:glycogen(starch) synthase
MKILIYSPAFLPMIGGLENMAYMLAKEWSILGEDVTVVTKAHSNNNLDAKESFKIIRNISIKNYWRLYCETDVCFFLNISLNGVWPNFLKYKPTFVSHQITYYNYDGKINFLEQVKRQLTRKFINISCSNFVKNTLPKKTGFVIPNAYNSKIFSKTTPYKDRKNNIIFVGRLVSDKGIDTLIKAIAILKTENNLILNLEIIGDGPELDFLKKLTFELGLNSHIFFLGSMIEQKLADKINEHQIMVVPSKWKEPFGLVALEGLACGCKMVVSKFGGLKEAVGEFAYFFENGNEKSLAKAILDAMDNKKFSTHNLALHLKQHTQKYIANKYLSYIYNQRNERDHV